MKIIKLQSENVKRLKAVEIIPVDGDPLCVIGGRNGAGKSSVLDSIEMALGGKNTIPSRPIRDGEEQARVVIDLGDYVVERRFTGSGSRLAVKTKEGASFSSPQSVLDTLCGRLAFDPLEWQRMKPAEQLSLLKKLTGLDFSELDREREAVYSERTEINREAKRLRTEAAAIVVPECTPDEEVSVAALMERLDDIEKWNESLDAAEKERAEARTERDKAKREVERIERELALARARLLDAEATVADMESEKLPERKDPAPVRQQVDRAGDINEAVRAKIRRAKLSAEAEEQEAESAKKTKRLAEIDAEKQRQTEAAEMPVEGLAFGAGQVLYGGVPFAQASSAEKLRVSFAMGAALNPKLRIMLIRDGSLLDEESLATLREAAKEADFQLWIERVGKDSSCQVIIEEGEVAE